MAEIEERPRHLGAEEVAKRILRQENAALGMVLVVLIGILAFVTKGANLTAGNVKNVMLQTGIRGVASLGQAFVILTAGIDLAVGGMGLVASVLGTGLMTETVYKNIIGYPMFIYAAIPIMLMVGLGLGVVNGTLVSRIGMPALIVTLGMWQICKGIAFAISGGLTIAQLPASLAFFGAGRIAGVPVPAVIFIITAVIAYFVLNHTTYGRAVYAVGGNPVSAWLSGINVKRIYFSVYVISGLLAGLAGVIMTGRTMSSSMMTLSGLELESIAAVTVGGVSLMGGKGTLLGVILGVIIIGLVKNAMSLLGAAPHVEGIVMGTVIITAVGADYIRRR